ncbi:MAG: 23S rRNA (uracil(1939)-C(5))-methyltransferase RlmD [Ruminococcaceae bacterium]|nr:23S rRNA (uracil(1939)-C(5))-methyltransferase RlmD [Oscillospiraceae bacterium]
MSCKYYKKCSGCQLQNLEYDEQLRYKQKQANTLLSKYGRVEKIVPMKNPLHYRNKVQKMFFYDFKKKKLVSGIYQSTTHRVVPAKHCMIEDEAAQDIANSITKLLVSFKIKAFDERTGRGTVRHVLVRTGFTSGEIMVVLVTATPSFPSKANFVKALLYEQPEITTVVHNVNPDGMNLTLGLRSEVLFGKGYIEDELCGCIFRISPASFYQVNPVQTENLYAAAVDCAELTGCEKLLDAYCGTGTIGIIAAKSAGSVFGVELNPDAVRDAVKNAERNNVKNIRFECGDAGDYITEFSSAGEKFDVVMMDPPRAGATVRFLKSLCKMKPKRIVYISCNPKTLARDLNFLTTHGYRTQKIQPFDMFPYTKHIETVVSLVKK